MNLIVQRLKWIHFYCPLNIPLRTMKMAENYKKIDISIKWTKCINWKTNSNRTCKKKWNSLLLLHFKTIKIKTTLMNNYMAILNKTNWNNRTSFREDKIITLNKSSLLRLIKMNWMLILMGNYWNLLKIILKIIKSKIIINKIINN